MIDDNKTGNINWAKQKVIIHLIGHSISTETFLGRNMLTNMMVSNNYEIVI